MKAGDAVELFDDSGATARGTLERCDAQRVVARIDRVDAKRNTSGIIVASAVPKGDRADWMIEKLCELGVDRFIPLRTARSVVLPTGKSKRDRWRRIATETSKQSRRTGVMGIEELATLESALERCSGDDCVYLTPESDAAPLASMVQSGLGYGQSAMFVGPEGGWTDEEISKMKQAGLTGARLTGTILRVETAAVVAAAVVACWHNRPHSGTS